MFKTVLNSKYDNLHKFFNESAIQNSVTKEEEEDNETAIATSPCGRFVKFRPVVGRGALKTVFRGWDSESGLPVAWCELLNIRVKKSDRIRFHNEAELLRQLQHPNVIRYHTSWEMKTSGATNMVLVTELMSSGTLKAFRGRFQQLTTKLFKDWCVQILKGLQYLHTRKPVIIHRDLKCENIFVCGASGRLKIGDLGLSVRKHKIFAKSVVGTPEFMAPEMYNERYDEAVDIYAFGMCMLELIVADYPYSECKSTSQIYNKVAAGIKPAALDKLRDARTRSTIEWCIEHNQKYRPTCADVLSSDFFNNDAKFEFENGSDSFDEIVKGSKIPIAVVDTTDGLKGSSKKNQGHPAKLAASEVQIVKQKKKKDVFFTLGTKPLARILGIAPAPTPIPSTSKGAAAKEVTSIKVSSNNEQPAKPSTSGVTASSSVSTGKQQLTEKKSRFTVTPVVETNTQPIKPATVVSSNSVDIIKSVSDGNAPIINNQRGRRETLNVIYQRHFIEKERLRLKHMDELEYFFIPRFAGQVCYNAMQQQVPFFRGSNPIGVSNKLQQEQKPQIVYQNQQPLLNFPLVIQTKRSKRSRKIIKTPWCGYLTTIPETKE